MHERKKNIYAYQESLTRDINNDKGIQQHAKSTNHMSN